MSTFLDTYGERITALREILHRCPETGLHEVKTTAILKEHFSALGLREVPIGMETGAAFRLDTGRNGRVLLIRADIDALPVQEDETHTLKSENPNRMHACGHDLHMAGLYGAAMALCDRRNELNGDVVFLLQPAEETVQGAKMILASGFMAREHIAATVGVHQMPFVREGEVQVIEGPLMAAKDSFSVVVTGKGGHGAAPEQCIDPIVAASALVMGLQTIVSRNLCALDSAVVTVSSIHSGSSDNVVEDTVTIMGGVRTLQPEIRERLFTRMDELVRGIPAAYGCTGELKVLGGCPAVVNSPALTRLATEAAEMTFGREHIVGGRPVMISEDFACYGADRPAFFFFTGSGKADGAYVPLHSCRYLPNAQVAVNGAELLTNFALRYQTAG